MPPGDKGKGKRGERGKGLKSAEVGRPPATCPAAEDRAGELEADGGKVTLFYLCRNAFLPPDAAIPTPASLKVPLSSPSFLPPPVPLTMNISGI